MGTNTNLNILFETLKNYGIDRKFVQDILLPEWWSSTMLESKAGYLQTLGIIAKNLNLKVEDLLSSPGSITIKNPLPIKFKTSKSINFSEKDIWPSALAARMGELIEQVYSERSYSMPADIAQIRNEILSSSSVINLNHLLDYLWSKHIPVLYISEFPPNVYKMDGMVLKYAGIPVILISKSHTQDPWLLFILAHELGHIVNNHISDSVSVIYDSDLESSQYDDEERQATETALKLLTGRDNPNLIKTKTHSAFELVITSRRLGKEINIDPGTIVLNYAYNHNDYPTAQLALRILNPKADAISLVKNKMRSNLNLDDLSEENYEYFTKLTGLTGE